MLSLLQFFYRDDLDWTDIRRGADAILQRIGNNPYTRVVIQAIRCDDLRFSIVSAFFKNLRAFAPTCTTQNAFVPADAYAQFSCHFSPSSNNVLWG